jgi:hypothetical protein
METAICHSAGKIMLNKLKYNFCVETKWFTDFLPKRAIITGIMFLSCYFYTDIKLFCKSFQIISSLCPQFSLPVVPAL